METGRARLYRSRLHARADAKLQEKAGSPPLRGSSAMTTGTTSQETLRNSLTDLFDTVYSECSIVRGRTVMSDAMIAAETQGQESTEAHDFVEMGKVSEETKGNTWGSAFDGIPGSLFFP